MERISKASLSFLTLCFQFGENKKVCILIIPTTSFIVHVYARFVFANQHFLCQDSRGNERRQSGSGIFPLKAWFRHDLREVPFWCVSESVRRATAKRMRHSRADSSIIKLPSQSSITQQGSRRPWRARRWAGIETHTYTHGNRTRKHHGRRPLHHHMTGRFPTKPGRLLRTLQSNWTCGCC